MRGQPLTPDNTNYTGERGTKTVFICLHERLCILYPSCHGEDFRSVYGVDQNADMGESSKKKRACIVADANPTRAGTRKLDTETERRRETYTDEEITHDKQERTH